MKGFIEVTDNEDSKKTLVSLDKIIDITTADNGCSFITVGMDNDGIPFGIETVETYDEIKQKIIFAR